MPKVNIWINKEDLKKIDEFKQKENRSRSDLLRSALLYYIQQRSTNKTDIV